MASTTSQYGRFCKPNLDSQLECLKLNLHYYKGEGNYLYYQDRGKEVKVLDFLGGFGTLMFGHNNEELVNEIKAGLGVKLPFASQGSDRAEAGELACLLNKLLQEKLGEDYLTVLSNSGTEAIEVCIKHCLYTHYHKKRKKREQIDSLMKKIRSRQQVLDWDLSIQNFFFHFFPGEPFNADIGLIINAISKVNELVLERPAVLLALERAFHGKTMGSIQLTFNNDYKKELVGGGITTQHIKNNDLAGAGSAIDLNSDQFYSLYIENKILKLKTHFFSRVAGFVIEPIQGEGGMNVIDHNFLKALSDTCKSNDIPIVFDEIQTGMGRTGTFLYAEQTGIVPDYVTLSKSLGGGILKIGATLIPRRIFGESFDKIHSSTFAEDALSAIVAKKCIELVEEDKNFLLNVCQRSQQLKEGIAKIIKDYPGIIKEIRGEGMMLGLEFESPVHSGSNCLRLLNDQDLLGYVFCGFLLHEFDIRTLPCLSHKKVLRIEPSGYTTKEECDLFLAATGRLCEVIFKENMFELCKFFVGRPKTSKDAIINSYRRPAFFNETNSCEKKVAFIGHFINASDMTDWDQSFELFTEAELEQILEAIYPMVSPFVSDRKIIRSVKGDKVQFDMLGFIITSKIIGRHMKQKKLEPLLDKINDCLKLAEANGCSMVGFGGFTSIITGNCKNIAVDVASYTTGNSFTTAMGLEAVFSEAPKLNIDPSQSTFAAVGAGGNIASVYCEFMAQHVKKIILVGAKGRLENINALAFKIFCTAILEATNPENSTTKGIAIAFRNHSEVQRLTNEHSIPSNYHQLYDRLEKEMGDDFPIVITDDLNRLKEAPLILSATNSPDPIIYPGMLGSDPTVICDIAVPFDVDTKVCLMKNVKVIKGGIVKLPNSDEFKIPGILLPKGTAYACMSETMLLGLEGVEVNYSYGDISLEQVKHIHQLAKKHGFKLEQPKTERSF